MKNLFKRSKKTIGYLVRIEESKAYTEECKKKYDSYLPRHSMYLHPYRSNSGPDDYIHLGWATKEQAKIALEEHISIIDNPDHFTFIIVKVIIKETECKPE